MPSCRLYSLSSGQLMLLSCLSVWLMCAEPTVATASVYASFSNVVFTNRAWVPQEPPEQAPRRRPADVQQQPETWDDGTQRVAAPDVQRPQQEPSWRTNPQPKVAAPTPRDVQRPQPEQSWRTNPRPKAAAAASVAAPTAAPAPTETLLTTIDNERRPAPTGNAGPTRPPAQYNHRERFSSLLYQPIAQQNANKNIIYSPASVHAMLGMLFGVSSGQTAAELQRAGQFSNDKLAVARDFARTLGKQQQQQDNVQFILANNLYFNQELSQPNPDYQRYAKEFYNTGIEPVNMKRSTQTSNRINNWVTEATRNIIRQLVTPNDIEEQDQALLVNAMYFKARWANEFSSMDTTAEKFWLNRGSQINVPMMYNDDVFAYAELPELDATAVELPYANTQTSMLLILPNQLDGLAQLERQLANVDLNALAARLRRELVTVRLPKFRIDFEQNMVGPLQRLGVQRIFTADSEVDAMLMDRVRMSKILQKAFIDVNEAGSEAAAASYAKFVPLSLPVKSRVFTANHPFFFAIRTPESVLFIGHVVEPPAVTQQQ